MNSTASARSFLCDNVFTYHLSHYLTFFENCIRRESYKIVSTEIYGFYDLSSTDKTRNHLATLSGAIFVQNYRFYMVIYILLFLIFICQNCLYIDYMCRMLLKTTPNDFVRYPPKTVYFQKLLFSQSFEIKYFLLREKIEFFHFQNHLKCHSHYLNVFIYPVWLEQREWQMIITVRHTSVPFWSQASKNTFPSKNAAMLLMICVKQTLEKKREAN